MVNREMPRVQEVVIPVLREKLPDVAIRSWVPDVDYRTFPLVQVRRLGGLSVDVRRLQLPVIELTAYRREGLVETEDLLEDARTVLWDMVRFQTVTEKGYLHSYFETMGPTQFDSPYEDTWRVQCLIQLGLRPPRNR